MYFLYTPVTSCSPIIRRLRTRREAYHRDTRASHRCGRVGPNRDARTRERLRRAARRAPDGAPAAAAILPADPEEARRIERRERAARTAAGRRSCRSARVRRVGAAPAWPARRQVRTPLASDCAAGARRRRAARRGHTNAAHFFGAGRAAGRLGTRLPASHERRAFGGRGASQCASGRGLRSERPSAATPRRYWLWRLGARSADPPERYVEVPHSFPICSTTFPIVHIRLLIFDPKWLFELPIHPLSADLNEFVSFTQPRGTNIYHFTRIL